MYSDNGCPDKGGEELNCTYRHMLSLIMHGYLYSLLLAFLTEIYSVDFSYASLFDFLCLFNQSVLSIDKYYRII